MHAHAYTAGVHALHDTHTSLQALAFRSTSQVRYAAYIYICIYMNITVILILYIYTGAYIYIYVYVHMHCAHIYIERERDMLMHTWIRANKLTQRGTHRYTYQGLLFIIL